jgi:hypothetical protein
MLTKNKRRALRRHHYERLKHSRRYYWGRWPNRDLGRSWPMTEGNLGVVARTPKTCSNPDCCGNPRRVGKSGPGRRTIQELKFYCEPVDI